jgi:hypothetical protein
MALWRLLLGAAWLLSGAALANSQLDDAPLRPPEAISVAALGDDVLVTWSSSGPLPFSMYWTILDGTGVPTKPPDAGAQGEFSFYPPHACAAPDAGLWLIAYPDKSGGGTTGGGRISASGAPLDGYGVFLSNITYTSRVRAAWADGRWWVVEQNSSQVSLFSADVRLATTPTVPQPQVGDDFEVAGAGSTLFLAWPGDGGVPTLEGQRDGGTLARRELTAERASAVAVGAQQGVVLLAWATATELRIHRFDTGLSSLDPGPVTVDLGEVARPRVSADDSSFLLVWTRDAGAGLSELRLGRVPFAGAPAVANTVRTGPLMRPDVAGTSSRTAVVAWVEAVDGGWFPFARRLGVAPVDAGTPDAGEQDAGAADAGSSDAGPSDAGDADSGVTDAGAVDAGTSDAGASDGGAVDAGPGPPATYSVGFGCSVAGAHDLAALLLFVLVRRRRG